MYRWQTEDAEEQAAFLKATVRLFRRVTGGKQLPLIGFSVPDSNTSTVVMYLHPDVTELIPSSLCQAR